MAETEKTLDAKEDGKKTARRKVYRNASARQYHIRPRPGQSEDDKYFVLHPGETIQALDEAEEKQFSDIREFKDVEKESPAIAKSLDELQAQLEASRKENEALKAQHSQTSEALSKAKADAAEAQEAADKAQAEADKSNKKNNKG